MALIAVSNVFGEKERYILLLKQGSVKLDIQNS